MPTIPDTVATATNSGCGVLWVANSITSTMMGFFNRNKQEELNEINRRHQQYLQEQNALNQEEKLREELKFRQTLMDLGRKYQQEASSLQFTTKIRSYQLEHFLRQCWPLDSKLPQIILERVEESANGKVQDLHVILLHTPLLPLKFGKIVNEEDSITYKRLEKSILQKDIPLIQNVAFLQDACRSIVDVRGGNSNIMNIHFLMNQLPTLVISPQYDSLNKEIQFTSAIWEPQASRPLIMPVFKIDHNPDVLAKDNEALSLAVDKIHAAVTVITGVTRDSYMMLTRHSSPTLPLLLNDSNHQHLKNMIRSMPEVKGYIVNEYMNIINSLDLNKNPKILEAYHPKEIRIITDQAKSIIANI